MLEKRKKGRKIEKGAQTGGGRKEVRVAQKDGRGEQASIEIPIKLEARSRLNHPSTI